uniref:Uncharacterized protein n=1 Tax=Parascaris equorum TaxID=6256 RepID=A0A914RZW9_PAREQ
MAPFLAFFRISISCPMPRYIRSGEINTATCL